MAPATLIIIIFFLIQGVGQLMTWLYWIQVKEYRYDRFFVFLKSPDGAGELLLILTFLKFLIIGLGSIFGAFYFLYITEIIVLDSIFVILFIKKELRKPVFTQRVIRIILVTSFLILLFTPLFYIDFWLFLSFAEISILIGPFIGIFMTGILVKRTLKKEIKIAQQKLEKLSPTVIAVTGSYGKTTTKDFITQILSTKYKVLSTYKNQNTHFGIIRRINSELKKGHQFIVIEIGAYKRGEIKEIAEVLKPRVAVITGLEPQHLELFGNFENLKKAKFELVEALRDNGMAFFNLTNPELGTYLGWTRKLSDDIKSFTYASNVKGKFDAISQISEGHAKGIDFKISVGDETKEIKTNLYSKRLIENLTGAILVARNFNVEWFRIKAVCKNLVLPEGTLNIFKTKKGVTIIDDSYNATPQGFEAAIEVLGQMRGSKKFVATTGVIELGSESASVHKRLGKLLESACERVILRNSEFFRSMRVGMGDKSKISLMRDPKKMIDFFENNIDAESVILIEGKLPQLVNYFKIV